MNSVPLVEIERSGLVESVHHGHVVVVDQLGRTVLHAGDPQETMYPRSAVKPLQAVAMVEAGLPYTGRDLALACGSHSGEAFQREHVVTMLAAAGLDPAALQCPPDLPYAESARFAYLAADLSPSAVAMNCSGKHAGMLATCLVRGWGIDDYLDPGHPLQQRILATLEELAGAQVATTSVDGCGAPLFGLPLMGLARAFAALPERAPSVVEAMRTHPDYVGGPDRDITALMRGVPGLVAKDGAEAVQAMVLERDGQRWGIALKIADGGQRARQFVAAAVLRELGATAPVLDEHLDSPVLGGGRPVGRMRMVAGWADGM